MSRIRRPAAPRKRPAPTPVVPAQGAAMHQDEAGMQAGAEATARQSQHEALKQRAIQEFESSLRGKEGIDEQGLEALLGAFRDAVREAPLDVQFTPLDPEEVTRTLNGLVDDGVLVEEDRNAIARQFEGALDPLQDTELQIALEFAQRVERDGEAEARQWLQAQKAAADANAPQDPPAADVVPHSSQAITRSRSRRLRGPPSR